MNLEHPNFGQTYRLSHLAIRLRTFTARELVALTGMVEDTVYGFLAKLTKPGYLQWEELPRSTRGRPVKRYTLTEVGLDFLLRRNSHIASVLRGEESVPSLEAAAARAAITALQQPAQAEVTPNYNAAFAE
jgi:DNA-binding PadR family transcriptional regulator